MDEELREGFQLTFMCPQCKQNQVVDDDVYTDDIMDINTGDFMVCLNCGAGYTAEVKEPFHSVQLLNIEEHEFDNTVAAEPTSMTEEESKPAFNDENINVREIEPSFEEDVALHTGINKPRNKDMSFEEYVESFGLGTADMTDEDYDLWEKQYNDYISSSVAIEGDTKMKYSTLVDKLTKITKNFMIGQGFEESEAVNYYTVDVSPTDSNDYMCIEVRAELDYDGMLELSKELDTFISTIYPDAYFDFEAPGIMSAYLPINTIEASSDSDKVYKNEYEAALFVMKHSINPKEIKRAQETIRKYKKQEGKDVVTSSLTNYGGAFDIDPYAFFTREELDELGYDIIECADELLDPSYVTNFQLQGIYFEDDYRTITAEISDGDYDYQLSTLIDMRKIKKPNDLKKYAGTFANMLIDEYLENHKYD